MSTVDSIISHPAVSPAPPSPALATADTCSTVLPTGGPVTTPGHPPAERLRWQESGTARRPQCFVFIGDLVLLLTGDVDGWLLCAMMGEDWSTEAPFDGDLIDARHLLVEMGRQLAIRRREQGLVDQLRHELAALSCAACRQPARWETDTERLCEECHAKNGGTS